MGSTFGGLNILTRSLYAQQASLETVGHNIANASTEGYSQQRVNLVTASPAGEVYGRTLHHSGSGVTVASITRARDVFVDKKLWKESSTLGYSQTSSEALSSMEGVFTEPSDTGIQSVLNQFWTSWQTLATQASDSGARTAVAQRGVEVVNAVQHAAQQLKDTAENINWEVTANIDQVNQITSNIYKLNGLIVNMEFGGTDHANDFRDSRDLLVDQLSKLVDVSVSEDAAGNYTILSSGVTLVDGDGYTKLDTVTTPNDSTTGVPGYSVTTVVDDSGTAVNFTNGGIKALIDSRDSSTTGIKGYMTSLETISQFLLQDFNNVHKIGYGTDNAASRNFFGADSDTDYTTAPEGGWLNALTINHNITDSTAGLALIAAKTTVVGNNNASGDNAILLGNCLKTTTSSTLGNISLDAYYTSMIGTLGVQSQDAQRLSANQQAVVDQLTNLRQSTSGVNMDEEMTNMIKFQKGYNAAARVLTAMDEMLDKLINGTGVVGR